METETVALRKVGECLYRNHRGTYFALLKVNGKQIKRSLKTEDGALARRRIKELRIKASGLTGDERGMRFEDLAERWLGLKRPELKTRSFQRLELIVKTVKPFFGGLPIRSIGQTQVEAWQVKRGRQISPRTFNYERDSLRALFDYAKDELRILLENPMRNVKKRKQSVREVQIPSKEQFRALVSALRAEPRAKEAADFVEFLAYSGLRLAEARAVRWRDINSELETLLVTGGDEGTKNHEVRTVPLFPSLRKLVEGMRDSRRPTADPSETLLFKLDSAKKALGTACRKLGLPGYGHHSMRHFFCSNAIEAGCDFKVIAGWLGHKDGGVLAARTYGHLRNEHSTAMAKRMTFDVAL